MHYYIRTILTSAIVLLAGIALVASLLIPRLNSYAALEKGQQPSINTTNWPRYMFSDAHQGNNPFETKLSAANAASLKLKWKFTASNHLIGEPIIVNGVIYEGDSRGNMYAINAATGKRLWVTPLGFYNTDRCHGFGITASAAVSNGLVYIGVGPNFYALSTNTGAIIWKQVLGPTNDTFIFDAASLANGRIYIGTASLCDNPLTQGMLFALNPTNGAIIAKAAMVPNGDRGGGVWDAPTIDVATGTVIVTTGSTEKGRLIPMTASVVTLNWNTLAVKQFWQVPPSEIVADADFGSSPTLFPGPNGKTYFGCINKNSIYYVFDEANVKAGPVWKIKLGPGGEKGGITGSIASSAYSNGVLYIPTALANVNRTSFGGSIGAFKALTGQQLWRFGTANPIVGSVITANGLLFDAEGKTLQVRDQLSGHILFSYAIGNIKGSITILDGVLYLPSSDKNLYALAPTD